MALLAGLPGGARAQQPVIERVYVTDDPRQDSVFALGSTIVLEVRGLNRWLRFQEELLVHQGLTPEKAHDKARDLVLYIDDAPLVGMPPLALYVDESGADSVLTARALAKAQAQAAADSTVATPGAADPVLQVLLDEYPIGVPDKVIFKLRRDVSNYNYWDIVYDSPWDYSHAGRLGLGYEDRVFTELHPRRGNTIRVELIQPATLWVAILGTIGLGLGLLVLGRRSWLLRTTASTPVGAGSPAATVGALQPAFSLAKVQMAWWTFVILGSFLVIYCVSGEMPDISTTSLALLGISGGTTALNALITSGSADPATVAAGPQTSRGWLTDIVSDDHGLSLNRLQQVVISLMMGYFFVRTVYNTVAMPVWTDNQILLLGISNATYLGLKWQESRTPSVPVDTAPPPAPAAASSQATSPDFLPATDAATSPA
ncbi:hypothetical protein E5K00_03750 [Hymenobacter aquaticus]|uniref:Uncharacterized protein n=1 Tax=Hymenobacter aquaticus TaxID=1867101 RepID=A0A4Z0Q2U1_9BACT|nr:hypothetical protein E5K00_03750 [Hymenobacter aquaticus]